MLSRPKVLYLSSIPLIEFMGGANILYRHLILHNDFEVFAITENLETDIFEGRDSFFGRLERRVYQRLRHTRLFRFTQDYDQLFASSVLPTGIRQLIEKEHPDVILTVAHGRLCWMAKTAAIRYSLPLVTIFHDWWSVLVHYVHDFTKPFIDWKYISLYRKSTVAMCVSQGMINKLGPHKNASVLPPIPHPSIRVYPFRVPQKNRDFLLLYAGNIVTAYGRMIRSLINEWKNNQKGITLKIYGKIEDWDKEFEKEILNLGIYQGFLPFSKLEVELSQANALLVVMSWEKDRKIYTETSFPCKFVDYCFFGRPIVVWGPSYSTVAHFASETNSALVVTDPSPAYLLNSVADLAKDTEKQRTLAAKAARLAETIFNPKTIHQQFVNKIFSALQI